MQGDDPAYLPVGTAVSAKYKGAFCEAKVSKVVRCVKCKITYKMGLGTATVTDEQIRGPLRVGHTVQARHSEKKEFVEATITKIQDCSQYTVVFDDGDITTLRRTALCLKSGRHFHESETLDQLPLTHPEHFGNPVVGGKRGRRSRQLKDDSSDGEGEEEAEPDLVLYSSDIGKVVCVEGNEKKKSRDNWFPGLVVVPSAQPTVRINVREEYLVRSFKDGRYYTVPKKEITEFSKELHSRIESQALSEAMEKAIKYLERDELPAHWERGPLFDLQLPDSESDENYSDSSDDEPREEKDHFVAQLYKFMDDRGTPLNKNPTISNKDVDMYRLFRIVQKLGGYNRVTNQSKWRSVSVRLGYSHNNAIYNNVKAAYKKYLFNFEDFYRKLGCTMINHPRNAKKHRGRNLIRDRDRATPVNSSPRSESESVEFIDKDRRKSSDLSTNLNSNSNAKMKITEKDIDEKMKKKELIEMSDSSSSNSSDGILIDVQCDFGPSTSKVEPKKKLLKGRPAKTITGEKVKALIEHFEEQSRKEAKPDDDKQTRSKSQPPKSKEITTSPDRKEIPMRIVKTPKKQPEQEDKKRGRKRKDTETENKSQPPETSLEVSNLPIVNIGDKLKVYYGPTHESKVTYEAKVLDIDKDASGAIYLVHYTGWNTRYDEWIKPGHIAENLSLTTKAKRLKQSQATATKPHTVTTPKSAAKRGRVTSVNSRSQDSAPPPPRSTTPSSVTSSSSRTKSPATPASRLSSRTTRRTRRISAQTDPSLPSDSDSEQSESEPERPRVRSESKKKIQEDEEKPKRLRKLKKSPDTKNSTESEDDSCSPPKGRDFDLNQIRSELKGFEKVVKATSTDTSEPSSDEKPVEIIKPEEKIKIEKQNTDDIYEFKEPEPFEFESRSKLGEDKSVKKRLVPRIFEDLEKSPKKKAGKSPPKLETKDTGTEEKKRFKRTGSIKKEEKDSKEDLIKIEPDPFDKLVESPSFNIGSTNVPESKPLETKPKAVKSLNMDETVNLFKELPEHVLDDSDSHSHSDSNSEFSRSGTQKEPSFSETKPELITEPIFRGFTDETEMKKCVPKDGSDEDDSISVAIQRAISNTLTDEESTGDDLFPTSGTEPLTINTDKEVKDTPKTTPKQISPALQETDSSLLDAISQQTELLVKKEELREPQIKTGTKIADSILQKFNLIKKNEENKPVPVKVEQPKPEPKPEPIKEKQKTEDVPEMKKRAKKVVSREFIDESETDTDSSDSEERLMIAHFDEDDESQTDKNVPEPLLVEPERKSIEEAKPIPIPEPDPLLLCKETIPGSPTPVIETVPVIEPSRNKPKSVKNLLLEMPFASAPGSSNTNVEVKSVPVVVKSSETQSLTVVPVLEQIGSVPEETNANIDHSEPTTPESTLSNLSPREQDRISSNAGDNESCKSTDSGQQRVPEIKTPPFTHPHTVSPLKSYSDSTEKKSERDDTAASVTSITTSIMTSTSIIAAPCRKRRRSCKVSDDIPAAKRGRRPNVRNVRANSDSDDTSEHSGAGSSPPTHTISSVIVEACLSLRSPKPSKYNFLIELDANMDASQRISLLQHKLTELRKTYNNVKNELAAIDRRRKKLRRREREALKAAKQEIVCS